MVNPHLWFAMFLTEQIPSCGDVKAFPWGQCLQFCSWAGKILFWESQAEWGSGVGQADRLLSCLGSRWTWKLQECCSSASYPFLCSSFQQLREASKGNCGVTWANHREKGKKAGEGFIWNRILIPLVNLLPTVLGIKSNLEIGRFYYFFFFKCCSFPIYNNLSMGKIFTASNGKAETAVSNTQEKCPSRDLFPTAPSFESHQSQGVHKWSWAWPGVLGALQVAAGL